MPKLPLYKTIYENYKEKILIGEYNSGDKLPTEKEIAKEFNVSIITVTRALKELEVNQYINRIQGSGSYVKEENAKHDNKNPIISLIYPAGRQHATELLDGIDSVAKEHNHFMTFHSTSLNPRKEKEAFIKILSAGFKGILLYPSISSKNMEIYSKLIINKYPFVLIDKTIAGLDLPLIKANNQEGFFKITNLLLELGHKRIIFVSYDVNNYSSEYERYRGFIEAHLQQEVPLLENHLYSKEWFNEIPSDYRIKEDIEQRALNYMFDRFENLEIDERPTAIAAVNDITARNIMTIALKREIKIPEDYSLTGFDNLPFASTLPVPLTTFSQPFYKIGKVAAQELFERIKSPEIKPVVKTLKGKLIIRKSTKNVT